MTKDPDWRFWIVTAAVSVLGTLSTLGTAIAWDHRLTRDLPVPFIAIQFFTLLAYVSAMGCSATAVGSLLLQGVKETGKTPLYCLPFYAAPWLPLALMGLMA
jgi:hypothetical protein